MKKHPDTPLNIAYRRHGRHWRDHVHCYPVVSRRSGGLSIGINLNPDKVCNFDCVYCQVDRKTPSSSRNVDLAMLRNELECLLDMAVDQSLFAHPPLDCLSNDRRSVRDIAFSGDGEPTTCSRFADAVRIAADAKRARRLDDTKIVLITNASCLTRPAVRAGLTILDENNGEIWAKLDAGTQATCEAINRSNHPLSRIIENITDAARARPIVIQSLWMNIHGTPPSDAELHAFTQRINEIIASGGRIKLIQTYTIARATAEPHVVPLSRKELDRVATVIQAQVGVQLETFYGTGG